MTTNALEVFTDIVKQLRRIENITPYNLEQAAETAHSDVIQRIENGINSSGQTMESVSTEKLGRYSRSHGRRRVTKGLPIDRVTLKFTGEMIQSFKLIERLPREVSVGFDSEKAAEIASYNAERFGVAFNMNNSEEKRATNRFIQLFNGFIK
ncbi:hypothetical protein [Runella zeae]|uniref:hypothetical protein n=1 Tax=Runella zeae TaxID=94255 RepID=UPI00048FA293|nr:hypothetical protein [Runella zeae]